MFTNLKLVTFITGKSTMHIVLVQYTNMDVFAESIAVLQMVSKPFLGSYKLPIVPFILCTLQSNYKRKWHCEANSHGKGAQSQRAIFV
jgi:hypothetical protein